jgi:hypothetical protein
VDAFVGDELLHAVDQEQGITMRQALQHFDDVETGLAHVPAPVRTISGP